MNINIELLQIEECVLNGSLLRVYLD